MRYSYSAVGLAFFVFAGAAAAHEYTPLFKAKKYAEIDRAATAKLQADPRNVDALLAKSQLIIVLNDEKHIDDAVKYAEQCVAARPDSSECYERLGDATAVKVLSGSMFSMMSSAGKIRDAYLKAVEIDPRNYSARFNLLQYYMQAPAIVGGGKAKAQTLIAETAKVNADAGKLLQAKFDAGEDKYAGAEALAWSANPGTDDDLQQMQRSAALVVAGRLLNDKKYAESDRIYRDIQKRYPEDYTGYYGAGRVLQEQGKCQDALAQFDKAFARDSSGILLYRSAQCLQTLQDKPRAIAAFEKALTAKPALGKKQREDVDVQLKALKS